MPLVKCYQRCVKKDEDGFCTRDNITLDTRGACLYKETADDRNNHNIVDYSNDPGR